MSPTKIKLFLTLLTDLVLLLDIVSISGFLCFVIHTDAFLSRGVVHHSMLYSLHYIISKGNFRIILALTIHDNIFIRFMMRTRFCCWSAIEYLRVPLESFCPSPFNNIGDGLCPFLNCHCFSFRNRQKTNYLSPKMQGAKINFSVYHKMENEKIVTWRRLEMQLVETKRTTWEHVLFHISLNIQHY